MDSEQDVYSVAGRVHDLFSEKGLTLSVAESCTGGLLSHCLTQRPGASSFFRAGVVAYSNDAKRDILGVPGSVIGEHGAVSVENARAMAERIRAMAKTDYSLSTTGNLGPDVLEEKERGLVYIAVSGKSGTFAKEERFVGERSSNKVLAALEALKFLLDVAASGSG
jgi:PncC family amidohydrolase